MKEIKKYILKYENELLESIVPFWEKNCIDKEYGGYFTFLDRDGSVYDTTKYMWMQWRIVYMFTELYLSKYRQDRWLDIAVQGYNFLTKYGKDKSGIYYFALNRKGVPAVAPYNIYSNCFAAMGAASLYKATGEKKYKKEAESAIRNYLKRLPNPKGKWNKAMKGKTSYLEFGHYMMLVNIGNIVKEYLGSSEFDKDIENSISIIFKYFWQPKYGVIFENIKKDYSIDLESCTGRHINPGHGLEAMWFLIDYAVKNNKNEIITKATEIIEKILEFGWDKKYDGIFYFMDVLGKPHIELQWDMKLWWVHNEAAIATIYAYYLTKEEKFFKWFKKIDKYSFKHFKDKKYPEWFGYLNRRGKVTNYSKGGKWKTFFHIPRYLLKSIEIMNNIIHNEQK